MDISPQHLAAPGAASQLGAPLFALGQLLATPKAIALLEEAGDNPAIYLARHVAGDWQEMPPPDQAQNRLAAQGGARVFSSYRLGTGRRIWVITEADRSCTTILSPDEY